MEKRNDRKTRAEIFMKYVFCLMLALLVVSCTGAAPFHPSTGDGNDRPDDFRVEYEWHEGSLPPPYHYEYTVVFTPSGRSEIVVVPDYPSANVPTWSESFEVGERDLDALHRLMVKNGLFSRKWRRSDAVPVGGSRQTLVVTAQGKQIRVDDPLVPEQQAPAQAIHSAVRELVPKEIWERLQTRRQRYMQEHSR